MIQKAINLILLCICIFHNFGFFVYGFVPQRSIISISSSIQSKTKCSSNRDKFSYRHLNNSDSDDNIFLSDDNNRDEKSQKQEKARLEVWSNRRKQIRATLKAAEQTRFSRIQNGGSSDPNDPESNDNNSVLILTAFVIAFGAVLLRVGGRAALVSTMGLDFAQENPELQTQLDSFLSYTSSLPIGLELVLFTLAWTFVKVFCFDAGGIVLALSAGILFGGVLKGAVASSAAATIGSSVAFGLAKVDTPVRKKALEVLDEYPSLRGIEKVVAKDGVKAILTLRLAPILPIPIGLYNYIYGVTNVPFFDFAAGIFMGSFKPYLLDSYLGFFGKNLIDGTGGESATEDSILLVALGVSTLIGVFASQLANETWEEIQKEVEAEKEAKKNDSDELENDGIVRTVMGLDVPEFAIGIQSALKAAEKRMEEAIEDEFLAKVWNYTDPSEIPEHIDPAKKTDSPEIAGMYSGFNFTNAICDGIMLSPVLFKTFLEYSDPLLDENEKIKNFKKNIDFASLEENNSVEDLVQLKGPSVTISGTGNGIDNKISQARDSQEEIDKYLFDVIATTKLGLEKRLEKMNNVNK